MKKSKVDEMPEQVNTAVSALRRGRMLLGLCPECGEVGRLDTAGGAICSIHGPYMLQFVASSSSADNAPEDWQTEE